MTPPIHLIGWIALGLAAAAFATFIVMLLWNKVLASVTAVRKVTYFQAFGILLLAKILFGGFGGGHHGWGHHPYGPQGFHEGKSQGCYEQRHCPADNQAVEKK